MTNHNYDVNAIAEFAWDWVHEWQAHLMKKKEPDWRQLSPLVLPASLVTFLLDECVKDLLSCTDIDSRKKAYKVVLDELKAYNGIPKKYLNEDSFTIFLTPKALDPLFKDIDLAQLRFTQFKKLALDRFEEMMKKEQTEMVKPRANRM